MSAAYIDPAPRETRDWYDNRVVADAHQRVRDLEQAVHDFEIGLLTQAELCDLAKPCVFR